MREDKSDKLCRLHLPKERKFPVLIHNAYGLVGDTPKEVLELVKLYVSTTTALIIHKFLEFKHSQTH